MLPPMRPRPIMPSCIAITPIISTRVAPPVERAEARIDVALEMHAERAPAALGQNAEIAARLRGLHDAELSAARESPILGIVAR